MTWTAPPAQPRVAVPTVGDERLLLESHLDFLRQTVLNKCAGLTAEQLRQRSVEPSGLSLLGLVRHLTEVERNWWRQRFAGQDDVPDLYYTEEAPDTDFDAVDSADPAAAFDAYLRELDAVRATAAGRSLDETYVDPVRGTEISLRWIFIHLIEEYGRHAGHADLLRERIDGHTGE
ncbi:DinB family protein [Streptodolium elevatio]